MPSKAPGPPLLVKGRAEYMLKRAIRSDPFISYREFQTELERVDINVCRDTVIAAVNRLDFHSFYAASKLRLAENHKRARLIWAKERVNWTEDQWYNITWSDESRFTLKGNFHGRKALRKVSERYEDSTVKWGGGGIMIWGCFWG
ncbi:MAG: hypothetical protein JSY10_24095 [Paenibacillus sp.]|nr:hypothetical protein [Paenibacillus sp.]